jgi:hypothetical protein
MERTRQFVQATGYQGWGDFQNLMNSSHMDWAVQQIGQPVPPLHADYWFGRDNSQHRWPVPGKVSIYIQGDAIAFSTLAMWRRLLERYEDSINVTIITKTQGYYNGSPPLTTAQEAVRRAQYYQDELHLPVTVAVDTTPIRKLPDGRIFHQEAAFESDPYYQYNFIMTDSAGKVRLLFTSGGIEEAWLSAWISKTLGP